MICEASSLYRGLTVTQEYFYFMEQPAGLLKAQINMTQCSLPNKKIIRLFDYGMIDYIIFSKPEETFIFGEKIKMTIGNITTAESVQAQIYSFPPNSYGLTEEPAKHEIFIAPLAKYTFCTPKDIQFIDNMDFYLFLEKEKRRMYQPLWYNFNLLAEGRTLQIWGPGNWKIRCPFAGEGHQIV